MADALETILTATGSSGALGAAALYALRHLQTQLGAARAQSDAVQEKRIADAQAAAGKLIEVINAQHANNQVMARALEECRATLAELQSVLADTLADRDEARNRDRSGRELPKPRPPVPTPRR